MSDTQVLERLSANPGQSTFNWVVCSPSFLAPKKNYWGFAQNMMDTKQIRKKQICQWWYHDDKLWSTNSEASRCNYHLPPAPVQRHKRRMPGRHCNWWHARCSFMASVVFPEWQGLTRQNRTKPPWNMSNNVNNVNMEGKTLAIWCLQTSDTRTDLIWFDLSWRYNVWTHGHLLLLCLHMCFVLWCATCLGEKKSMPSWHPCRTSECEILRVKLAPFCPRSIGSLNHRS